MIGSTFLLFHSPGKTSQLGQLFAFVRFDINKLKLIFLKSKSKPITSSLNHYHCDTESSYTF